MKPYKKSLKQPSRQLRNNMTDAEQLLWSRLRRKQIHNVQFNRQKPLLGYIVDFYCAKARLVIELDGSQHFDSENREKDILRDKALAEWGLHVLRFDNLQVLTETESVVGVVYQVVGERLHTAEIPPNPPFSKGGT